MKKKREKKNRCAKYNTNRLEIKERTKARCEIRKQKLNNKKKAKKIELGTQQCRKKGKEQKNPEKPMKKTERDKRKKRYNIKNKH